MRSYMRNKSWRRVHQYQQRSSQWWRRWLIPFKSPICTIITKQIVPPCEVRFVGYYYVWIIKYSIKPYQYTKKRVADLATLFCGPTWAWTKDPLIMSQVLLTNWAIGPLKTSYQIVLRLQRYYKKCIYARKTKKKAKKSAFSCKYTNILVTLHTIWRNMPKDIWNNGN